MRTRTLLLWILAALIYLGLARIAELDLHRLVVGLPKMGLWVLRAWPPDFSEFPLLLKRAGETIAMATLGSTFGAILAAPLCILAARNVSPDGWIYWPARSLLNLLRGIDSFVFALLFVVAVGLGPFAGVIGIALHSAGTIAKLWSETIETSEPGPLEAAAMTAASRVKLIGFAILPDALPSLASIALYTWEFNLRSSTVLGLVGAGGIGQELKNAVDLLDFPRVAAILLVIVVMVTAIDQLSARLRRALL
jgi:phosphonate transport system permease protein